MYLHILAFDDLDKGKEKMNFDQHTNKNRMIGVYLVLCFLLVSVIPGMAEMVDITDRIQISTANKRTTLDRRTRLLTATADITIVNISEQTIEMPLHAVFTINGTIVSMADALGGIDSGPYNTYYLDLSSQLPEEGLAPSTEITFGISFASRASFTYDLSVFGNIPQPPQLVIEQTTYTVDEGQTLAFTVSATDPENDTVTLSATPIMENASFDTAPAVDPTGTFTFAPDYTQAGTHEITFQASDTGGLSHEVVVQITVSNINQPPTFTSSPVLDAVTGESYTYQAQAQDPDTQDTLTFTLVNAPQDMTIDSATGLITWQPSEPGPFDIELQVTDGQPGGTATQIFTITVSDSVPDELVVMLDSPQEGQIFSSSPIAVTGTCSDPMTVVQVNKYLTRVNGDTFEFPAVPLNEGVNEIALKAGNYSGQEVSLSRSVILDTTPPILIVTRPYDRSVQVTSLVTISGYIDDATAVTCNLNGNPFTVQEDGSFETEASLNPGENTIAITCVDAAGNTTQKHLTIYFDDTPLSVESMTPEDGQTDVAPDTTISVTFSEPVMPESVSATTFFVTSGSRIVPGQISLSTDGQTAIFTPKETLESGSQFLITIAAGITDTTGNPMSGSETGSFTTAGGLETTGAIYGEVFDNTRSRPLASATVEMFDQDTGILVQTLTTDDQGRYFADPGYARMAIRITKPDYTTVFRQADTIADAFTEVLDARLTPLGNPSSVKAAMGAEISDAHGNILNVPPGAFSQDDTIFFTSVGNQGPAVSFPAGWSPLGLFNISASQLFNTALTLQINNMSSGLVGETVVFTRFDDSSRKWIVKDTISVNAGLSASLTGITQNGQYAALIADTGDLAPESATAGAPLSGITPAILPDDAVASGEVVPSMGPADDPTPAQALITITSATPLSSGTILRGDFMELVYLREGGSLSPTDTTQDLAAYRKPGDTTGTTLEARFPIAPSKIFQLGEVTAGTISVTMKSRDRISRNLVGPDGGGMMLTEGRLTVPENALSTAIPVSLQALSAYSFPVETPDGLRLLGGFNLDLAGETTRQPLILTLENAAYLAPTQSQVVVAQIKQVMGKDRLVFVALAAVEGNSLTTVYQAGNISLPGIREGGRYGFYAIEGNIDIISGTARDADNHLSGHLVECGELPFCAVTDTQGRFYMPVLTGTYTLTVTGSIIADQAVITSNTDTPLAAIVILPTPPRVASIQVRLPEIPGDVMGPVILMGTPAPVIDDDHEGDSSGDGDGVIEPGETIEMTLTLRNEGSVTTEPGSILLEVRVPGGRLDGTPVSIPIEAAEPNEPVTVGPFVFQVPSDQNPADFSYSMYFTINGGLTGTNEVPFTLPLGADHIHVEAESQVLVSFSEPVTVQDPSTALTLTRDVSGSQKPVEARVILSSDGLTATLRPIRPLTGETLYRIHVNDGFQDADGRHLAQAPYTETFRTKDNTPPAVIDAGNIEATVPDENGMVHVTGSMGSVAPDDMVILLNEDTGITVLATVHADGSFSGEIPCWTDQSIAIIIKDRSDNQTRISVKTLVNRDPATGEIVSAIIGRNGGEFVSDDDVRLILAEGAVGVPTEVSVSLMEDPFELPADIENDPVLSQAFNDMFTPVARIRIDSNPARFNSAVDIELPAPADAEAGDLYVVVRAIQVETCGVLADMDHVEASITAQANPIQTVTRLTIVESATVKAQAGGRLVIGTDSPPFTGILESGEYTLLEVKEALVFLAGEVARNNKAETPISKAVVRTQADKDALKAFASLTDSDGQFVLADQPGSAELKEAYAYATRIDVADPYYDRTIRTDVTATVGKPAPPSTTVAYLDKPVKLPVSLPKEFIDVLGDIEPPVVSIRVTGPTEAIGLARVGDTLTATVTATDNDTVDLLTLELGKCNVFSNVAMKENTYTLVADEETLLTFRATATDPNGNTTTEEVNIRIVGGSSGDPLTATSLAGCGPMPIGGAGYATGAGTTSGSSNGDSGTAGGTIFTVGFSSSSGGSGRGDAGDGSDDGTDTDGSCCDGCQTIQLDSDLTLVFSEPLDPNTVTTESIRLLDPEGQAVGIDLSVSEGGNVVTIDPKRMLRLGARYEVEWSSALTDLDGNSVDTSFSSSFCSEVEAPEQKWSMPFSNARDVDFVGPYLAVVDTPDTRNPGDNGHLSTYKIRDDAGELLEEPELVSRIETNGHPYSLAVDGAYVYVVNQYLGELATFTPLFTGFGALSAGSLSLSAGNATSVVNSLMTGVTTVRNKLPDPPSNIQKFCLCNPENPHEVARAALSKNEDVDVFTAFTDPTAWNLNSWPIRVEVKNGLVYVLNSHENIQVFDKNLELADTIESVGGVYTWKGRCEGGQREGKYCVGSVFDLFFRDFYCGEGGTCKFTWEFLNAAFFDGYAVSVEKKGLRIVWVPVAATGEDSDAPGAEDYRGLMQYFDHTLIPELPDLFYPMNDVDSGIPKIEGVSDFEWTDEERGVNHKSDVCFISSNNGSGNLHCLLVKDAQRPIDADPDSPWETTIDPFRHDPPELSYTIENKSGTMSIDKERGILYSITANKDFYVIDFNNPYQLMEVNDPGGSRSPYRIAGGGSRSSWNGVINYNGEVHSIGSEILTKCKYDVVKYSANNDRNDVIGWNFSCSEACFDIYVIMWDNQGPRIKWNDARPEEVARTALYSIWRYCRALRDEYARQKKLFPEWRMINEVGEIWGALNLKKIEREVHQLIGHAAMVGKYYSRDNEDNFRLFCISHTGGNPGIHGVNMNMFEVVATHVDDGHFDTPNHLRWRLENKALPRIVKRHFIGEDAQKLKSKFEELETKWPIYYGLNTDRVRIREERQVNTNFDDEPPEFKIYYNELSSETPLQGGCGNTVASALLYLGLPDLRDLIPINEHEGWFSILISQDIYQEINLPIRFGENAFDNNGFPRDPDVMKVYFKLEEMPDNLGGNNGDNMVKVEFYDPSKWYDWLSENQPPTNMLDNLMLYYELINLFNKKGIKADAASSH